jgi:hypothetical protein
MGAKRSTAEYSDNTQKEQMPALLRLTHFYGADY